MKTFELTKNKKKNLVSVFVLTFALTIIFLGSKIPPFHGHLDQDQFLELIEESTSLSVNNKNYQEERVELKFNNELNDENEINLSWEDFIYLCSLEREFRSANPTATPDDVAFYLNSELENINHNNTVYNTNSLGSGINYIFGVNLTSEEIALFAAYPVQAIQAYNASVDATSKEEEFYTNPHTDNNNSNAFRHGYWNALMEKRISKDYRVNLGTPQYPFYTTIRLDFAKMFADAHEYGMSGPSTEMDYLNNAVGRSHGALYKDLSDHNMAVKMTERIANGEFYRNINGQILPSNWEYLKPEYIYNTSTVSGGLRINSALHAINSAIVVPSDINGQSVITINNSAFANQTQMTHITIPSTIVNIGSAAFKNTNNAPIYLQGRAKAPITFNLNWNSSANPVYLNGTLCTHSSKNIVELNATQHGDVCNDCRTVISTSSHNKYKIGEWEYCHDCSYSKYVGHTHTYSGPYIPAGDAGHLVSCSCGATSVQAHIAGLHEPGDRYVNCMRCDYLIDLWTGGPIIIMRNNHTHEGECEHIHDNDDSLFIDYVIEIDIINNPVAIIQKEEEFYQK